MYILIGYYCTSVCAHTFMSICDIGFAVYIGGYAHLVSVRQMSD